MLPYRGKVIAAARAALCCPMFSRFLKVAWLLEFGIFNVRTAVDACDCTRGLYEHLEKICTEN